MQCGIASDSQRTAVMRTEHTIDSCLRCHPPCFRLRPQPKGLALLVRPVRVPKCATPSTRQRYGAEQGGSGTFGAIPQATVNEYTTDGLRSHVAPVRTRTKRTSGVRHAWVHCRTEQILQRTTRGARFQDSVPRWCWASALSPLGINRAEMYGSAVKVKQTWHHEATTR
jgi:hypothetical protein